MWLWPRLIQNALDEFCQLANSRRSRKQRDKLLPSGVSANTAYVFPERFGGHDCLQPVDVSTVEQILDDMVEVKEHIATWGVPPEFALRCEHAKICAGIREEITISNVWPTFFALLYFL